MSIPAILPLALVGAGAAVAVNQGQKAKRKIAKKPCNALQKLYDRGPGVYYGAIEVARATINRLPPVKIPEKKIYPYTVRLANGRIVNDGVIVRSNYPQILRYAKEAFKLICNKSPDIELGYETRDELLNEIGEGYDGGVGGGAELIKGHIPDKWLSYVSVKRGMTSEESEALGWICMAVTYILTGSSSDTPVRPYDHLDDFDNAEEVGYKYLSDNSKPLITPSSVFNAKSINFLRESNKEFDRELSRYLNSALDFYVDYQPNEITDLREEVNIEVGDQLFASLTGIACSKFLNDKFNKKDCTNDAILHAMHFILAYEVDFNARIENLTEVSDYPPVLFIRYNDRVFENAVDIAEEMYADSGGAADILLISRAVLIATSTPGTTKIDEQFVMAMEYYDRMASGDFNFPSFLNYASYKNDDDMLDAVDRALKYEPLAYNLLERIMSAVAQRVSNLEFG